MNILDGKLVAQQTCNQLKDEIKKTLYTHNKKPCLCVFLIGDKPESRLYVNSKIKRCEEVGIVAILKIFDDSISESALIAEIKNTALDKNIHGIMVQLPLPKHISEQNIITHIPTQKDVDGMTYENLGRLCYNDQNAIVPATPMGILMLLKHYKIETKGKHCVVVGRSQIVGRPISILLSNNSITGNASVVLCHSHTKNLEKICSEADIIIAAIGKPKFITASMVKPGAIIIDVGINEIPFDNTKGKQIVGDVDFENVQHQASFITPVPGGVGPMTIAALMFNSYQAFKHQENIF